MDTRFHCVYLLTSLDPACKGDYYIGYTVNPLRRLRQHNGELVSGAKQTKRRGRPWTLVCCVSGFTEDRAALKFEWCWQRPAISARLKHTAPTLLKGLRKLPFAVGVLHLLIHAELFSQLELTLHVFEADLFNEMRDVVLSHVQSRTLPSSPPPPVRNEEAAPRTVLLATLPELKPTELFHLEETTRESFAARYLLHDTGGGGGGGSPTAEGSNLCPYDLSGLSQTVMNEWGSGEDSSAENDYADSDRSGSEFPFLSVAGSQFVVGEDDVSLMSSSSLPPLPLKVTTGAGGFLVPIRFKHFKEADFLRLYEEEQVRVDAGSALCTLCGLPLHASTVLRCPRTPFCPLAAHLGCLAMWVRYNGVGSHWLPPSSSSPPLPPPTRLVPASDPSPCPLCTAPLRWGALVKDLRQRVVAGERLRARQRRQWMEARLAARLGRAEATNRTRQRTRAASKRARSVSPTSTDVAIRRRAVREEGGQKLEGGTRSRMGQDGPSAAGVRTSGAGADHQRLPPVAMTQPVETTARRRPQKESDNRSAQLLGREGGRETCGESIDHLTDDSLFA